MIGFRNLGIRVWDSSNPLAEEYIRGCIAFPERVIRKIVNAQVLEQEVNEFFNIEQFIDCQDFIHTGYVALSQATQLLYNDICNAILNQNIL